MSSLHSCGKALLLVIAFPAHPLAQISLPTLPGIVITSSTVIAKGVYTITPAGRGGGAYLTIQGENIEIDFNAAVIDGRVDGQQPDAFNGVAVHVKNSKNVTIKNLSVHGFKIAILAENVVNLNILSCNLSYNYKPRLYSRWDREALSDWLYYHQNEQDEWKQYGAAIYLKQCDRAVVRDVVCHQGMNGLLMVQCCNGQVYNNDIRFNSGLGIGMYRSRDNQIMHNRLDWNARGYSHGKYARGQDSSAILLYEQSSNNIIAYNSGTHSGDGLFLWSGQSTMDTGLGGCDSNMIYKNDFSHSIANGIEATFSSNYLIGNILNDCRYGVWGGYSHHSIIRDNEIRYCEAGIAIEHGRYIRIEENEISHCDSGIRLWDRSSQPSEWPYAQKLDVRGRQYLLGENLISHVGTAYDITSTDSLFMEGNRMDVVENVTSLHHAPVEWIESQTPQPWMKMDVVLPAPLPHGILTTLPNHILRGLKYILIDEWGPYDFQSPKLALRQKEEKADQETLHFDILGPPGKWKVGHVKGCSMPDHLTGVVPDSIRVKCHVDSVSREITLIYLGDQIITPRGDTLHEGTLYPFGFHESTIPMHWTMSFFYFDSFPDPIRHPVEFQQIFRSKPLDTWQTRQLAYRWWGQPGPGIPPERFAIEATSQIFTQAGDYILEAESDDGIRVWLDDTLILDRWDVHTPAIDHIRFTTTAGQHRLKVEYFEAGGLAVLDVMVRKIDR